MAGEHEFILSLIGELDEGKTKANVQKALENVSKNVSLKSNSKAVKNAITVFDKEQLEKDGIAYLKSAKDIESQLSQMFKGVGTSFEVNKTFADDGSISKFIAKIYEGTTAIQTLNFEAAKFSDNTVGFRQVGGSAKSGKISTEIQNEIESLKTQNEQLDLQDVLLTRLYQAKQMLNDGSISSDSLKFGKLNEDIRLLENQINSIDFSKISYEGENHLNAVTNATLKAVEAEHKLHNVMMDKKTGVFNIPALEKEGIAFYDNTVGIVERVKQELESKGYQPKIQILSRDTEGQATRFVATFKNASGVLDTINYDLVQLTDGIRTFDGFMSSFGKQVDNTSETNAKAFQKQTKSLAEMELKLRSIRENAFGGTKPLLDEKNIDAVNNKLKYAEGILRGIQSGHDANKIIPIEAYNKFDLVLKEIKQDITVFKDEETIIKQASASMESQFDILNKYEQKVKDIRSSFSSGRTELFKSENINIFKEALTDVENEIDRLKNKAGQISEEEFRNLINITNGTKRLANTLYEAEESERKVIKTQEQKTEAYQKQTKAISDLEAKLQSLKDKAFIGNNALKDSFNIEETRKGFEEISALINNLKTNRGTNTVLNQSEFDSVDSKLKEIGQDISVFKDMENSAKQAASSVESQLNTLNGFEEKLKNLRFDYLSKEGGKFLNNSDDIKKLQVTLASLDGMIDRMKIFAKIDPSKNTEKEYRELLNAYNATVKLAQGFANVEKSSQSQLNKFASFSESLKGISEKYLTSTSPTKLMDADHINDVKERIGELTSKLESFKTIAGNVTNEQIREYQELSGELERLAQRYANIEKAGTAEEKTLLKQQYTIEDYLRSLRKIKETTINPNSDQRLKDTTNFTDIENRYKELYDIISKLENRNQNGKIVSDAELMSASAKVKELTQDINILSQAERDREKNKIVQDGFAAQLNLDKERLKTFIQELQRDNLLTKEFRIEIGKLATALYHVKTPEALKNIERDMAALSEQAKRTRNDMQDSISGEQLQQKIRLLSAQVVGYMSQNTKAVGQFKSQFDALRNSINNITDANGLAKAQNEFKLLQQNINNAGQAGMTFGERMSAAIKKFLMWTGMTNVVMYFVRSIKQMITHTKELDSAMTFLKRVTNETDLTYRDMFDNAIKKAKELNSSVKDLINSTAEFAKLGFTSKQAEQLAEATTVYARVGQLDVGDATESIVSTISGFKDLEASDVWKIVDEFDNIGKIVA